MRCGGDPSPPKTLRSSLTAFKVISILVTLATRLHYCRTRDLNGTNPCSALAFVKSAGKVLSESYPLLKPPELPVGLGELSQSQQIPESGFSWSSYIPNPGPQNSERALCSRFATLPGNDYLY